MALICFIVALLVFVLKMFGVGGEIDMLALGLALVTLGFILGGGLPAFITRTRTRKE
jgi:hypothetical protein